MSSFTRSISLRTRGFSDVHDLTPSVRQIVEESNIAEGIATTFVPGSTAGITTIEFEEGALEDLREAIERLIPQEREYAHNTRWGDGNGFSHIRAAILGPSVSIPIVNRELALGTWQQIVVIDFDNRPRSRNVIVTVVGDAGSSPHL